jgi:hypothetical protein
MQLSNLYASNGLHEGSYAAFVKWFASLPSELVRDELDASAFEKSRLLKKMHRITPDSEIMRLIKAERKEIITPIRGIPYEGREEYASKVKRGEPVILESEPNNVYDPNAIKIIYMDHQIGYVQNDIAKLVAREILARTPVSAIVSSVAAPTDAYPFPWIEVLIQLGIGDY